MSHARFTRGSQGQPEMAAHPGCSGHNQEASGGSRISKEEWASERGQGQVRWSFRAFIFAPVSWEPGRVLSLESVITWVWTNSSC